MTEPPRRGKQLEVVVAEVRAEAPDAATLILFTGNERLEHRAGQALTVDPHQFEALHRLIDHLEEAKGCREPPRTYAISSAPLERHLAVTVKEERYVRGRTRYPPLLSPLLVRRTAPGTRLAVTGAAGPYVLPDDVESRTDHLVHLVAGSGAVPNFALLKDALVRHPSLRHTWLGSDKAWEDVLFRRELAELERRNPARLRVIHTLTRDPVTPVSQRVWKGRVSAAALRALVPDPTAPLVYACGPSVGARDREDAEARGEAPRPRFLEAVSAALAEVGVPADRVVRERWG